MFRFQGLQVRFLASLVLSVAAALATVAIVARWSTTTQFEQYVNQNRAEMQQVAQTIALDTGNRVVVANAAGRVFLDSSSELLGTTLAPAPFPVDPRLPAPPPGQAMVFVRQIGIGDGPPNTDIVY